MGTSFTRIRAWSSRPGQVFALGVGPPRANLRERSGRLLCRVLVAGRGKPQKRVNTHQAAVVAHRVGLARSLRHPSGKWDHSFRHSSSGWWHLASTNWRSLGAGSATFEGAAGIVRAERVSRPKAETTTPFSRSRDRELGRGCGLDRDCLGSRGRRLLHRLDLANPPSPARVAVRFCSTREPRHTALAHPQGCPCLRVRRARPPDSPRVDCDKDGARNTWHLAGDRICTDGGRRRRGPPSVLPRASRGMDRRPLGPYRRGGKSGCGPGSARIGAPKTHWWWVTQTGWSRVVESCRPAIARRPQLAQQRIDLCGMRRAIHILRTKRIPVNASDLLG